MGDSTVTAGRKAEYTCDMRTLSYLMRVGAQDRSRLLPIVNVVCEYGSARNGKVLAYVCCACEDKGSKALAFARENPSATPDRALSTLLYYAGFRTARQIAFDTGRDWKDEQVVDRIANDLEALCMTKCAVSVRHDRQRYCATWKCIALAEELPPQPALFSPLSWFSYICDNFIQLHRKLLKSQPKKQLKPFEKPEDEKEPWERGTKGEAQK